MEQRHLILVDEQSQRSRLSQISNNLKEDGIELIYEEINPKDYYSRQDSGDVVFDMKKLRNKMQSIPFLHHLDVFATDYNLIDNELKGIDVVAMLNDLIPHYRKQMVIYSAQIETVIKNIFTRTSGIEDGVKMLKLMSQNEITYLSSVSEFETKFKQLIIKEKNISIDDRLAESLCAMNSEIFKCSIPGFNGIKINEIGKKLLNNGSETITLKKEIAEQIVAYITSVQGYE